MTKIIYSGSVRETCKRVADQIIAQLNQGTVPWVRPYNGSHALPFNAVRRARENHNKPYTGVNRFFLELYTWAKGWRAPAFLTIDQLKKLNPERDPDGPRLRRKDGGIPLSADDWRDHGQTPCYALLFRDQDVWLRDGKKVPAGTSGAERVRSAFGRAYALFNVEQCVNLPDDIMAVVDAAAGDKGHRLPAGAIARALEGLQLAGGVKPANTPCYWPGLDAIGMPPADAFISQQALDATWLHEMGHACGHPTRCGREPRGETRPEQIKAYAREELCAELTSAMAQEAFGLPSPDTLQHAAYLKTYVELLTEQPDVLVWAASQAEKRTNLLFELAAERIDSVAAE